MKTHDVDLGLHVHTQTHTFTNEPLPHIPEACFQQRWKSRSLLLPHPHLPELGLQPFSGLPDVMDFVVTLTAPGIC